MDSHAPPSPRAGALRTNAKDGAQALLEHALLLLVRQHGGEPAQAAQAQAALLQWRGQSPAHEAAARTAEQAWLATQASDLAGLIERPGARRAPNRRVALRAVAALAAVGGSAWMGLRWWDQPTLRLALTTEAGQTLVRTLADGSVVDLAANTALEVVYYRDRRQVLLQRGEARFDVAKQGQPFMVLSPWASVRVLGTSFSVSARADSATVRVATGRVAIWRGQGEGAPSAALAWQPLPSVQREAMENRAPAVSLGAGQSVTVRRGELEAVQAIESTSVGAWRHGWMVFNDTPLAEAVGQWNDYLRHPVEVAQPVAQQPLRLTGSFPLEAPGDFFASLPAILPVCVRRLGDGRQIISLKQDCPPAMR